MGDELLKVNWSAELADCGSTAGGNCEFDEKFMKWVNVNKLFEEKKPAPRNLEDLNNEKKKITIKNFLLCLKRFKVGIPS